MQELEGGWFLTAIIAGAIWGCCELKQRQDRRNERRMDVLRKLDLRSPHVIEMEKKRGAAVLTVVDSRPLCIIEEMEDTS